MPPDYSISHCINYFEADAHRKKAFFLLKQREEEFKARREFENDYNDFVILIFDNYDIPFSLDLHGFKKATAVQVVNTFIDTCHSVALPKIRIIHGHGKVLHKVVNDILHKRNLSNLEFGGYSDDYDYDEDLSEHGHVDVILPSANINAWPSKYDVENIVHKPQYESNSSSEYIWQCVVCKQRLKVPVKENKLIATCKICDCKYEILNRSAYPIKTQSSCNNCSTTLRYPLTSFKLKVKCPSCYNSFITQKGRVIENEQKTKQTNSDCFIATAVYKDQISPEVQVLQKYRDCILINYHVGRLFTRTYYKYGKVISKHITRYKLLEVATKKSLDVLIALVRHILVK